MNNQIQHEWNGKTEAGSQSVEERVPTETEGQHPDLTPVGSMEEAASGTNNGGMDEGANWHAEAGRKGARRVHQLIQHGLLYEQEHGLKRGRQRLRQLIEEGKLYEQEHELKAEKRQPRRRRVDRNQVVRTFVSSLLRLVQPGYRDQLAQALRLLEGAGKDEARAD